MLKRDCKKSEKGQTKLKKQIMANQFIRENILV